MTNKTPLPQDEYVLEDLSTGLTQHHIWASRDTCIKHFPAPQDEYVLEDLSTGLNCLVQRVFKTNFAASWDEAGEENQAEETYQLTTVKSLQGSE